jgi:hypothetical protein
MTQTFSDAFSTTGIVRMGYDSSYLYVCMTGVSGQNEARFARVYLDTRNSSLPFAGETDYALQAQILGGATSSYKGTGVPNGYTPITLNPWSAATATGNNDVAEYAIGLPLTGGWCGDHFRLAVYHHWVSGTGDDYGWPSGQYYDQPGTWQEVVLDQTTCASGKIAYVYREDTSTATHFKTLLTGAGFTVDLIPLTNITTTVFNSYDAILIANDTGNLDQWGTSAGQVSPIASANKPMIGLGEGGYAFFGKLGKFIGWPQGWHGPMDKVISAAPALTYYHTPFDFTGLLDNPIPLYPSPVNEVGIYTNGAPPDVTVIGNEPPPNPNVKPDHAPLIAQGCNQLWGFSNGPQDMNDSSRHLFINAVTFALTSQCEAPPPPPPPGGCVTITKSALPAQTAPVHPGDVIKYTIDYAVADQAQCATTQATLIDQIQYGGVYVPGSASGGITPNSEGTLIWPLGNLAPGARGSQSFSVAVLENACDNQVLPNRARLQGSTGTFDSNLLQHTVVCPPVIPTNREPPYAEEEVQVYPYPLVTGHPTQLSVRLRSLSAAAQTVTVTFQTSPDRFGIGLSYGALPVPGNPRVVTLPPHGVIQVQLDWTPVTSGHYCIQVKIEGAGFSPIYTQRNLDVSEDLRPGITDDLTFSVGNPTSVTADIDLVVDNTCPGWTASVEPVSLSSVGPADSDIRTVTLHVTPPLSGILGTGCHIDVQGWIGGQLIGGIRKLDIPPVHLPSSDPPWEEKEITVDPDPPVVGQPTQYCIEVQNPLAVSKVITLTYTVADFGAGVGFMPVGTRTLEVPPHSLQKYCISWTPSAGGTLHRCLRVVLEQSGFREQSSQRNLDLVHARPAGSLIDFVIGNPFPYTRTLSLQTNLIGLAGFVPHFTPDPPPDGLGPGESMHFTLEVREAALSSSLSPSVGLASSGTLFGDSSRAEVSVYLGDDLIGGFTVEYQPRKLFLPLLAR